MDKYHNIILNKKARCKKCQQYESIYIKFKRKQTWLLWRGLKGLRLGLLSCSVSSVQLLSRSWLFVTPWIAARQASLSITNSRSLLKLMPIESVMPSSHLILCRPLLPLPPIPPSIRVFSNESVLHMRWPKYWSFSFSRVASNVLFLWLT